MLEEYEDKEDAVVGPKSVVEFGGDEISLDIGVDVIRKDGWHLSALVPPTVC